MNYNCEWFHRDWFNPLPDEIEAGKMLGDTLLQFNNKYYSRINKAKKEHYKLVKERGTPLLKYNLDGTKTIDWSNDINWIEIIAYAKDKKLIIPNWTKYGDQINEVNNWLCPYCSFPVKETTDEGIEELNTHFYGFIARCLSPRYPEGTIEAGGVGCKCSCIKERRKAVVGKGGKRKPNFVSIESEQY